MNKKRRMKTCITCSKPLRLEPARGFMSVGNIMVSSICNNCLPHIKNAMQINRANEAPGEMA